VNPVKIILVLAVSFGVAVSVRAADVKEDAKGNTKETKEKKELFLQVGALEKKDGDKYLLRKRSSHLEFYIDDETSFFLKRSGSPDDIEPGRFIIVKGPKNSKTVLANAVYVYESKEDYEEFIYTGKKEEGGGDKPKRRFSVSIKGIVADPGEMFDKIDENMKPVLMEAEGRVDDEGNPEKYFVSFDENTYWVFNKRSEKNEIKIGGRLKLYFDERISIRYKSYPVKIIIDRAKVGY